MSVPNIPSICYVCKTSNASQIVPDRSEDKFYVFCPLCLDELIGFFPLLPSKLMYRELHGVFPK